MKLNIQMFANPYVEFKDYPNTTTPLSAINLNKIQTDCRTEIGTINDLVSGNDLVTAINNAFSILAPVGCVNPFAGDTAPTGWLMCDGSAVSRTTYSALYSVIGTTYGEGDGSTTFNLPNLTGKTLVGYDSNDTDFNTLGANGGAKKVTLIENELPQISGSYTLHAQENGTEFYQISGHATGSLVSNKYRTLLDLGVKTDASSYRNPGFSFGGDQAHENMPPYVVMNHIIKY